MAIKKRVSKKKTARKKVAVSAKSRATGKAPTKRLKQRRAANTKKGYYPNPVIKFFVIKIVKGGKGYYFDGMTGDSNSRYAAHYRSQVQAKQVGELIAKKMGNTVTVYVEEKEIKKS